MPQAAIMDRSPHSPPCLKRVLNIHVSVCPKCGGEAKVTASIEDQQIIEWLFTLYMMLRRRLSHQIRM